ncbi:MAG TPA: hypothetical protein VND68_04810 [Chloroflexia bacterium]|jgi:hypothetical protein|nr:hypothetical protein [Chloroflexia bacterium]
MTHHEYIHRDPGELITAEDWNGIQTAVQADIVAKLEAAKQEIKRTGVSRADNADKFDNKTPKDLTDDLDKRYAYRVHDHEGQSSYRRYIKRLEVGQTVVLEHKLGRFPLVDVYELLPVAPHLKAADGTPAPINDRFYLYYGHEERDRDALFTRDRGTKRWAWGTPIEQVLRENKVEWEDDDSLGDVINDLLDAFFNTPDADEIEHGTSAWINDHRKELISTLKLQNEWPDIYWTLRPFKLIAGYPLAASNGGGLVDVTHLSYDTLAIIAPGEFGKAKRAPSPARPPEVIEDVEREFLDLMILLRS